VKTPAGTTLDAFWSRLLSGRSTAATITRYDPAELPVRIGCEVPEFDITNYIGPKEARRLDRVTQLGFAAAADALADAGDPGADPARCAVILGTGIGGLNTLEEQLRVYVEKGPGRVSPFLVPMMMTNATAGTVAMQLGWTGPNLCISTACAASAHAIGEAARLIRDETSDVVMTGGSESCMTKVAVAAFARMTALSGRNDDPEHASRPFDAARDGFVMGEGASALLLENWDRADATPMRTTSLHRRPVVKVPPRACNSRSTTPGSPPPTSATSTRTAPRPRSTTRPRPKQFARCSAGRLLR
jgi:3-oxoacyl-[acyl-carrier-protein] synthase II